MENIIVLSSDEDDDVSTKTSQPQVKIPEVPLSYKVEAEVDDFDYGIVTDDTFSPQSEPEEEDLSVIPHSSCVANGANRNQSPLTKG